MMLNSLLSWIFWNPNRVAFTIPIINWPVAVYGLWFLLGFIVAYFLLMPMFTQRLQQTRHLNVPEAKQQAQYLLDRLTWFIVIGSIAGARLGHVFFYDWPRYQARPMEIFYVWKGGLASHGGVIGIFIALFLYTLFIRKQYPSFTFLYVLDCLTIPSAFAACCIRIGNFWNQEILGKPTTLPWGVIFGDPMDGGAFIPRHPVQLYEAASYFLCFALLFCLWQRTQALSKPGRLSGIFFTCIFSSRFILEFFKTSQSIMIDESYLQTGQLLSLPLIIMGIYLLVYSFKNEKNIAHY